MCSSTEAACMGVLVKYTQYIGNFRIAAGCSLLVIVQRMPGSLFFISQAYPPHVTSPPPNSLLPSSPCQYHSKDVIQEGGEH